MLELSRRDCVRIGNTRSKVRTADHDAALDLPAQPSARLLLKDFDDVVDGFACRCPK